MTAADPGRPSFLADFPPAYFALVMATGILAIACLILGIPYLPAALFWINVISYVALWVLTALRLIRYPRRFAADFESHQRGPGLFTTVAATAVLGVQLAVQYQMLNAARVLWWFAFVLWALLTYGVFTALTVRDPKPTLAEGINGGWLTSVVAIQSLVVLGTYAPPKLGSAVPFVLVTLWLAGGMLYIWMISLIFYRYTFFRFLPSDLMPPYWINMGAMAISTLGGALLIRISDQSPLLTSLRPFLEGFTLLYWATATWWIPMLILLGVWRHIIRRFPLRYDPLYWGAVFPVAMYTTATFRLSQAMELPFLMPVCRVSIVVAIAAWALTFLGLILTLISRGTARAAN